MNDTSTYVVVGKVTKPHGIKGELLVSPLTDNVDAVFHEGRQLQVGDVEGHPLALEFTVTVERVRPTRRGLILAFADLHDRDAAEMLRGRTLLMVAEDLPPLDEDEYFIHDLEGLEVRRADGAVLGRVAGVYPIGPTHVLGVRDEEGERLIPFSEQIVQQVNLDEGWIVVDPPAGLLDL